MLWFNDGLSYNVNLEVEVVLVEKLGEKFANQKTMGQEPNSIRSGAKREGSPATEKSPKRGRHVSACPQEPQIVSLPLSLPLPLQPFLGTLPKPCPKSFVFFF